MVGNALQHLAQIRLRVQAVQFRRADQAIDGGTPFAAGIRTREQIVLPAQSDSPQGTFGGVVVDFDVPVFGEA